ncbi:probable inactive serine protease 37 [Trichosurus vulpecula]|uniref:probable inactive serine protease 37 n=1 Tax=Trichosurus vulpecula TaxID=9337 RepID=UPI00186B0193|nr:probable inactive serine protease 37 [Trichosurus vulpecula]
MKFIILFILFVDSYCSGHGVEQVEVLDPCVIQMESHFKSCEGVFTQQQCLPVAAHCYVREIKVMLGNSMRRIKKGKEEIINSSQIIQCYNFSTDLSRLIMWSKPEVLHDVQSVSLAIQNLPTGKHLGLNFEAPLIGEKKCQKLELRKTKQSRKYSKIFKSFRKLCLETWKWYWLLSAALARFRARKVRHFLGVGISDIYHYILSIQNILSTG